MITKYIKGGKPCSNYNEIAMIKIVRQEYKEKLKEHDKGPTARI